MKKDMHELGKRCEERREALSYSLVDVSRAVGRSDSWYRKMIEKSGWPSSEIIPLLATALDTNLRWLLTGIGTPTDEEASSVDAKFLAACLSAVEQGLKASLQPVDSETKAAIVSVVYKSFEDRKTEVHDNQVINALVDFHITTSKIENAGR